MVLLSSKTSVRRIFDLMARTCHWADKLIADGHYCRLSQIVGGETRGYIGTLSIVQNVPLEL